MMGLCTGDYMMTRVYTHLCQVIQFSGFAWLFRYPGICIRSTIVRIVVPGLIPHGALPPLLLDCPRTILHLPALLSSLNYPYWHSLLQIDYRLPDAGQRPFPFQYTGLVPL